MLLDTNMRHTLIPGDDQRYSAITAKYYYKSLPYLPSVPLRCCSLHRHHSCILHAAHSAHTVTSRDPSSRTVSDSSTAADSVPRASSHKQFLIRQIVWLYHPILPLGDEGGSMLPGLLSLQSPLLLPPIRSSSPSRRQCWGCAFGRRSATTLPHIRASTASSTISPTDRSRRRRSSGRIEGFHGGEDVSVVTGDDKWSGLPGRRSAPGLTPQASTCVSLGRSGLLLLGVELFDRRHLFFATQR